MVSLSYLIEAGLYQMVPFSVIGILLVKSRLCMSKSSRGLHLKGAIYTFRSPVDHDNPPKITIPTTSPNRNQPLLQHRPARFKLSSQLVSVMLSVQHLGQFRGYDES